MNQFVSIKITRAEYELLCFRGREAQIERLLEKVNKVVRIVSIGLKRWKDGGTLQFRLMAWVSDMAEQAEQKRQKRTTVPDDDIRDIRTMREQGVKRRVARAKYPDLTDSTFENIWQGYTGAHIGPAKHG